MQHVNSLARLLDAFKAIYDKHCDKAWKTYLARLPNRTIEAVETKMEEIREGNLALRLQLERGVVRSPDDDVGSSEDPGDEDVIPGKDSESSFASANSFATLVSE